MSSFLSSARVNGRTAVLLVSTMSTITTSRIPTASFAFSPALSTIVADAIATKSQLPTTPGWAKKLDIDESTIGIPLHDGPFHKPPFVETRARSLESTLDVESVWLEGHRPKVVGHRGAVYHELENTVQGFQLSSDLGCEAVELDVFLLKCGTLVVFHGGGNDENPGCLRDYFGVEGNILDYSASESRILKFNHKHDEFVCPKHRVLDADRAYIPTLEEVLLNAKSTGITVKIELKGPGTPEPVLQLVDRLGMVDQCHFSSFSLDRIAKIRELRPERSADGTHRYKTGCLFNDPPENFIEIARSVGASEVHLKYDTCTKQRVDAIHSAGMDSMAWFRGPVGMKQDARNKYHDMIDEDDVLYELVAKTGVRSMCVNKPDVLVSLLERRGEELASAHSYAKPSYA